MSHLPNHDLAPVDPPADGGDEYGVTPIVRHWSDMPKPAADDAPAAAYDVGEEVPEAPYRAELKTWREVVAGGPSKSGDDEDLYDVGPQSVSVQRRSRILALFRHDIKTQLRANEDRRIGRLADPRRFTLGRLIFVFTLASIVLAVGTRFPRGVFAGVSGGAALAMVFVSRSFLIGSAFAQLAWGTLIAIYLLASLFSLLQL